MALIFHDTSPEAEETIVIMMRNAPVVRKAEMVAQLSAMLRHAIMSGIKQRYSTATEAELRRRFADIILGPELAQAAYGPLP